MYVGGYSLSGREEGPRTRDPGVVISAHFAGNRLFRRSLFGDWFAFLGRSLSSAPAFIFRARVGLALAHDEVTWFSRKLCPVYVARSNSDSVHFERAQFGILPSVPLSSTVPNE